MSNRQWLIEIGAIPPASLRGNSRAHYMVKYRDERKWQQSGYEHAVFDIGRDNLLGLTKVRLTFTFYHWRNIDLDNLAIGLKPFVDGFTFAVKAEQGHIGFDDDPSHVVYGEHQFVKVKKGQSKTEVLIEELCP